LKTVQKLSFIFIAILLIILYILWTQNKVTKTIQIKAIQIKTLEVKEKKPLKTDTIQSSKEDILSKLEMAVNASSQKPISTTEKVEQEAIKKEIISIKSKSPTEPILRKKEISKIRIVPKTVPKNSPRSSPKKTVVSLVKKPIKLEKKQPIPIILHDTGNAPISYGSPKHKIANNIFMGKVIREEDGITLENGSDLNGTRLTINAKHDLKIKVSKRGYLNAWIDYNADGDFQDIGEKIFTGLLLKQGTHTLRINIPLRVKENHNSYFRFRFSSTVSLDATSIAKDGEVEDYLVYFLGTEVPHKLQVANVPTNFEIKETQNRLPDSYYFEPIPEIENQNEDMPLNFVKKLGVVAVSDQYEANFTISKKIELAKEGIVTMPTTSLATEALEKLEFVETLGIIEISDSFESIEAKKYLE